MPIHNPTRQGADHLIQWLKQGPWPAIWEDYWQEMLEKLTNLLDMDIQELMTRIEESETITFVFGAVFEHFLTLEFPADALSAPNLVEDYLKRRGWKELPRDKAYLEQMHRVPFSVYEVMDVIPGESVTVQDLICPVAPVTVLERSGSQQLKAMDHLVAKVVNLDGQAHFTGNLLKLDFTQAEQQARAIRQALQKRGLALGERELKKDGNLERIRHALQDYSESLILAGLEKLLAKPRFQNREGHSLLFGKIRFPVKNPDQVIAVLDTQAEFERAETEEGEPPFWNWLLLLDESGSGPNQPGVGIFQSELELDEGLFVPVRGTLELTDKGLLCEVTSRERAEILVPLLQTLLGGSLGQPSVSYQSLEAFQKENKRQPAKEPDLSPEEQQAIMEAYMDEHYRKCLDQPLSMLNGKTPRQAVKTKAGKVQVTKWLRYLESHQGQSDEMPGYDFAWMWEALGLERP